MEALDIVDRADREMPGSIETWLCEDGAAERPETPTHGDPLFERVHQYVLADGIDCASDAAGAVAAAETVGADGEARTAVENNDAGGYFERHDCLVFSGQTSTNVNDLCALVIDEG